MPPISEAITTETLRDRLRTALQERFVPDGSDSYVWVDDIALDEPWLIYCLDAHYFRIGYTITDEATGAVALVGEPVEKIRRVEWVDVDEAAHELLGDVVDLVEATVRRDGTIPVKLIAPGWSKNNRYYSASVLESDGPAAFPAGTHMFWDHPSASEAIDRPERSLRDLSAVTVGDARWEEDGPTGAGLYADAKVMAEYQPTLEELAPYIGVSIRAGGTTSYGEADGRSGELVERITVGKSADFVTTPAAGGEIVSLFESVRATGPRPKKEPTVADKTLIEVQRDLTEAERKLEEATALGTLAAAERDRLRIANAKLQEGNLLTEATRVVTEALGRERDIPDVTKQRLAREIADNPPFTEAGELDKPALATRFTEAVKVAREELAAITGSGSVRGLGGGDPFDEAAGGEGADGTHDVLVESFKRMGLNEAQAKEAAAGR